MPHPVPQASAGRQHVQSLPAEDHHLVVVGESFEHPLDHALLLAFLHKVQAPLRVDVGEHLLDQRRRQAVQADRTGARPARWVPEEVLAGSLHHGCLSWQRLFYIRCVPGRGPPCASILFCSRLLYDRAGLVPELPQRHQMERERLVAYPKLDLPVGLAVAELRPQHRLLQGVLAGSVATSPGRRLIDGLDLPLRHLAFGVPDEQGDALPHESLVKLRVEADESAPVHPRPIPRCHACHGPVDQQQIQRLPAQQGQLEAVGSPVAHAAGYALGALLLAAMLRVDVVEHLHDHLARQGQQAPHRREAQLPARRARELRGLRAQLSLRHGCLSWQWLLPRASLPSLRSLRSLPLFPAPIGPCRVPSSGSAVA